MHSYSAGLLSSSDRTRSVWDFGPSSGEGKGVGKHAWAPNARTAVDDTGAMAVSWIKLAGLLTYLCRFIRSMTFGDSE